MYVRLMTSNPTLSAITFVFSSIEHGDTGPDTIKGKGHHEQRGKSHQKSPN